MKVSNILINNLEKPFGFSFSNVNINIKFAEADSYEKYDLELEENGSIIFTQKNNNVTTTNIDTKVGTKAKSEYRVIIKQNDQVVCTSSFESGYGEDDFVAKWIAGSKEIQNNIFFKKIQTKKEIKKARLYMSAQGVYEVYIDGVKVGDEVLAPGFTHYNKYTQIQTYDVTKLLSKTSIIEASVGDGWFKGTLGFGDGEANIYGDVQAIIGEIDIEYIDGSKEVIGTDESWQVRQGSTTASAIYYGQDIDLTLEDYSVFAPTIIDGQPLIDRLSVPVKVMEVLTPVELIKTPAGETVIDFGQNHSGWVKFLNTAPKGQKVVFEFGEILQAGNFYRDNLREARARFEVISDGEERLIAPNFTFFGYRYLKVVGIENIELENFRSEVIYSDINFDTYIKTNNDKINRLMENVNWGEKSNFIDVPTDCPQRNERLGWTGDANVFGETAMISSNVIQFYKKYLKDIRVEQEDMDGMIPMYAPSIGHRDGGSSVWADVITMLPWNMYIQSGDVEVLSDNFEAMKSWLSWVAKQTKELDNPYIWTGSFQFGDWLALDGSNPSIPSGGTDENFIATMYYYMSTDITAKTARVLGYEEEAKTYSLLANKIKTAILEEYITVSGKMTLNTQTGYALMLESGLLQGKQKERVIKDLIFRLNCDSNLIQTGFVGTPLLCPALSKNGYHDLAVDLFLNEDSPSWLYAVNLGATTIWERWNSVLEDGTMNPEGMNSLNHYSYGAIKAWVAQHLLGIQNSGIAYDKVTIVPGINSKITEIAGNVRTNGGYLDFKWKLEGNCVVANISIPVGTEVTFDIPGIIEGSFKVNNQICGYKLGSGEYTIEFVVDESLTSSKTYSLDSNLFELAANKDIWSQLTSIKPQLGFFNDKSARAKFGHNDLMQVAKNLPFINFSEEEYSQIEAILK